MFIVLGAAVFAVIFVGILYNRLVALRQTRKNSFYDIDVQLKLRHDLVPNLVETVKGYAVHEKDVLENVTASRAQAMKANSIGDKLQAETGLDQSLFKLMAVSENYPDLKANQGFISLQNQLSGIENTIAAARRFFNNSTAEYNTARQQFPASLFSCLFGFKEEDFYKLDAVDATVPTVNFS